jgi:5-methylcytosine-specific restriction endonuclease McrA
VLANSFACAICGRAFTPADPAVADHIVPHSMGGSDHASNLRAVHKSCNAKRGNRLDDGTVPPVRRRSRVW